MTGGRGAGSRPAGASGRGTTGITPKRAAGTARKSAADTTRKGAAGTTPNRSGRRTGHPDTRGEILVAARGSFAAHGFAGATIRGIARTAGVDPALVHHYFGTKHELFLATIDVPVTPRDVISRVTAGPPETVGLRLAAAVLNIWESDAGTALLAAVRSAIADPALGRTVREFLRDEIIQPVLAGIGCPPGERDLRGALLASQLGGVLIGRHLLALEPLASQPLRTLIPPVGVTLQRYLTGPLPRTG